MYVPVTTEDFDTWIKAESRTFETRCDVIIGNTTYRLSGSGMSGDIISMQWNNVVCSNDGLQIGTSCMDEFRMEYRNNGIPSLMNSEIHPYVGLVIPHENTGDVTVWIPLGVFYVTNTETNDDGRTYSITAYDGMQKFMGNVMWSDIGITEFPVNAWTLLTAIATHFGVTVSYDDVVYQLLSSDDYVLYSSDDFRLVVGGGVDVNKNTAIAEPLEGTYREYIGWIAGLVGANAHMGREGDLVISRYTDHGYSIGRNIQHMGGAKINYGGAVTYTAIVSGTDSDPVYSSSRTGNAITYTNPFISTTELDRVCDALLGEDGITVTPCNVEWRSDPRIDAGDIVSVEGSDGNFYSVYVMDRTVTITGGLSETLNCYGETEVSKSMNTSPIATKMASIEKKATEAENVAKQAADYINNTHGTFRWIDNGDGTNGGFTIYEDNDTAFLRCTAGGIGLSQDGGLTYTNAITKEGVIASRLSVAYNDTKILDTYYDSNSETLVPYVTTRQNYYDVHHGTRTLSIYSTRYESTSMGGYGMTGIIGTNPVSKGTAFELSTRYFDDETKGTMATGLNIFDVAKRQHNSIGLASYMNSVGATVSYLSFVNPDTRNTVFYVQASGDRPGIVVYDPDNSVSRSLNLTPITINGTTYYMFAST